MVNFSISALLDGLVQISAFLLTCLAIYYLLKLLTGNKFETHFGRTLSTVAIFVFAKVYISSQSWGADFWVLACLLYALSLVMVFWLLKPNIFAGPIVSITLTTMGLGMEKGAAAFTERFVPEGPTFAEYMGVAQEAIEKNKQYEGKTSSDIDMAEIMRTGLDALASLTKKEERDAISTDFSRGMSLFAERKAWMDSLTPEEKKAYREEVAAFLAEQGIAQDRYSLAAMKDVEPTNLVALTTLFEDLQNDEIEQEVRIRSIPESIAQIAANISGFELTATDQESLRGFAELFGKEDVETAMAKARKDLEEAGGNNQFLGTVLAAMVQAESDLPISQLLNEEEQGGLFDKNVLKEMASNHWKKQGKNPEEEWLVFGVADAGTVVQEITEIVEPVRIPEPDPFIKVTTSLGVVSVPNDEREKHEWIAVANCLSIKGYVALGDEVVILRTEGGVLRKGEYWALDMMGYTYRFKIDAIVEGRVSMQAVGKVRVLAQ